MSSYTTHQRGHDAEWLLQQEMAFNDRQVAAVRAGRKPMSKSYASSSGIGALREVTPAEAALAARAVTRMAAGRGEDGSEVLQMLGLAVA
ncbi:hypothetical protein [Nonomuraea bangladeshensis]|uniref:hypothetical protein n=1 Tax=Nonomuraea bangladeshensis TaxID=404385 RepID=UPI003C2EE146